MGHVCLRCHEAVDFSPDTRMCPVCGVPRPSAGWPSVPGEWIPGLWLEALIERGGMGAVYRGRWDPARRSVARAGSRLRSLSRRFGALVGSGPSAPPHEPTAEVPVAVKIPVLIDVAKRRNAAACGSSLGTTMLAQERNRADDFVKRLSQEMAAGYMLETCGQHTVQIYNAYRPPWAGRLDEDSPLAWIDDLPYMVMELVDGWTVGQLASSSRGSRFPLPRARRRQ